MRHPRWFAEATRRRAAAYNLDGFRPQRRSTFGDGLRLDQSDCLRLSGHPDVVAARAWANGCEHAEPPAAWMYAISPQEQHLTTMLCRVLSAPEAILTSDGWTANVGLLEAIASPDRPVYIDRQAHASMYEGTRLAGAHRVGVRHNDPEALERKVRHGGPGIVCIDAVDGGDGSVADVRAYIEVCERYACVMVLDEAHSFGMLGRRSRRGRHPCSITRLARALRAAGLDVGSSGSHIVSIRFRDSSAWSVLEVLRDVGITGSVVVHPAVPFGTTSLRFAVHADITTADVDRVASATTAAIEAVAATSVLRLAHAPIAA